MTKQQKLEAIYEEMADKTMSGGCLYRCSGDEDDCVTTIIGHPVHIGYVLGSLTRDSWHSRDELFGRWGKFRLPIDDQSEECIDFVYSLIAK